MKKLNLPKVSIIVTNYNYADYILNCLQSINCQTYKNIECIIIDDCSTDNSVELIEMFIENDSDSEIEYVLLKNEETLGQFGGFQRGIKHSTGEFISFIDSDDMIFDDYVNIHLQVHFNTSVALTVCKLIEIDQNNTIHTLNSISSPTISENSKSVREFKLEDINTVRQYMKGLNLNLKKIKSRIIDANSHPFGGWYWAPTSCGMFRKTAINLLQYANNPDGWNVCADKYLYNYAHLIGGSALFSLPLVAYRKHDNNNFAHNYLTGNKKYFSDKSKHILNINNKKIAGDTLNFLIENRDKCIDNFGSNGLKDIALNISKNSSFGDLKKNLHYYKKILHPISDKQIIYLLLKNNIKFKFIKLLKKYF